MTKLLLPFAAQIIDRAISKIPDDAELGELLINVCVHILEKAVKLTKTEMDDNLLAKVKEAIKTR